MLRGGQQQQRDINTEKVFAAGGRRSTCFVKVLTQHFTLDPPPPTPPDAKLLQTIRDIITGAYTYRKRNYGECIKIRIIIYNTVSFGLINMVIILNGPVPKPNNCRCTQNVILIYDPKGVTIALIGSNTITILCVIEGTGYTVLRPNISKSHF